MYLYYSTFNTLLISSIFCFHLTDVTFVNLDYSGLSAESMYGLGAALGLIVLACLVILVIFLLRLVHCALQCFAVVN